MWPAGVLLFLSEGENLITVLKLGSCPPPSSSVKACLLVSLTLSWQCIKPFTWPTSLGCSYHLIFLLLVMDRKDSNTNKKTLQILPRISQNCWLEGNVMWLAPAKLFLSRCCLANCLSFPPVCPIFNGRWNWKQASLLPGQVDILEVWQIWNHTVVIMWSIIYLLNRV